MLKEIQSNFNNFLFIFLLTYSLTVFSHMCVSVNAHACSHICQDCVWRSEENLQKPGFWGLDSVSEAW